MGPIQLRFRSLAQTSIYTTSWPDGIVGQYPPREEVLAVARVHIQS